MHTHTCTRRDAHTPDKSQRKARTSPASWHLLTQPMGTVQLVGTAKPLGFHLTLKAE